MLVTFCGRMEIALFMTHLKYWLKIIQLGHIPDDMGSPGLLFARPYLPGLGVQTRKWV